MRFRVRAANARFVLGLAVGMLVISGPQIAIAAFDALNSDKVDGRHAVGPDATAAERANKLVATNSSGVLPNNIILKARNADRLDNLDASALQRRVTGECTAPKFVLSVEANGSVTCATDRINGGNAQTLDGKDSTAFAPQNARTISVSGSGTPVENGTALSAALLSVPEDAAPGSPWIVVVGPGVYSITGAALNVPQYTTLVGEGPSTLISVDGSGTPPNVAIQLRKSSVLRSLRVEHSLGGAVAFPVAVQVLASDAELDDVDIRMNATSPTGVLASVAGAMSVSDVRIEATGTSGASAMSLDVGVNLSLRDSALTASATGANGTYGLVAGGTNPATTINLVDTELRASGGSNVFALGPVGKTTIRGSSLMASSTSGTPYAIAQVGVAGSELHLADSLVDGSVIPSGQPLVCFGAYDEAFVGLNSACQ